LRELDAARELRKRALETIEPRYCAVLWRSEGFDLLRLGRPTEALEAFRCGIHHLDDSPFMYGVARADELYYGAAMAAFEAGDRDAARGYYRRAANAVTGIRRAVRIEQPPPWWDGGLESLRRELGEPSRKRL